VHGTVDASAIGGESRCVQRDRDTADDACTQFTRVLHGELHVARLQGAGNGRRVCDDGPPTIDAFQTIRLGIALPLNTNTGDAAWGGRLIPTAIAPFANPLASSLALARAPA